MEQGEDGHPSPVDPSGGMAVTAAVIIQGRSLARDTLSQKTNRSRHTTLLLRVYLQLPEGKSRGSYRRCGTAGAKSCHSPEHIHGPILPQHRARSPPASAQPAGCRQGWSRASSLRWAGRHLHHCHGAGPAAANEPGGCPPGSPQGCSRTWGHHF